MFLKLLIVAISLIAAVSATGQLTVVDAPASLTFKGGDKLESESVGDVFAAALGQSIEHPSEWNGLYINNPFETARGVVALIVDGVNKVHIGDEKSSIYPLAGSSAVESIDGLMARLVEDKQLAVDIDLAQGFDANPILGDFQVESTKKTSDGLKPTERLEDKMFVQQLAALDAIAEKLKSSDVESLPVLMTVRVSLSQIVEAHAGPSPALTDAMKQLTVATDKLMKAAQKGYQGDALVAIVTVGKDELVRNRRAADTKQGEEDTNPLNLAPTYSPNYPVMFNIMLWFGVIFAFSLLAISYAIATMDPGRDSIIYRMTSNRMKKEN